MNINKIPINDIIVIINPSQKAIVALLLVATLGDITSFKTLPNLDSVIVNPSGKAASDL